jgi:hypothetical protein
MQEGRKGEEGGGRGEREKGSEEVGRVEGVLYLTPHGQKTLHLKLP